MLGHMSETMCDQKHLVHMLCSVDSQTEPKAQAEPSEVSQHEGACALNTMPAMYTLKDTW